MDSPSTEKDDPSRVSEDAILDSLFCACDTENSGRVSVSKLIEYLRNAISNGTEEFAGNLDDLSLIWDPDGRDLEIDLTSFQEGIKEWISDIRQRSFANVEDDHFSSPSAVNCMDSPEPRSYSSPKRISNHDPSTPNVSSDSVEGLGGVSPDRDWDRSSELISTIENLQVNNKRLLEQHNAMQAQMESTEESNSQLTAEVESLQKQLRSYQLIIDKSKEKNKENTELRQAVSDALDANQCLQTKISQLEKERALYESNINGIGEKLLEAQAQIELLEEEKQRLIHDLAEQKQYCTDLQEIQGVKNDMIAKESSTNSSMIVGLASENETLKMEKGRLENRILDLEENVLRLKMSELSAEKSQLVQNGPALTSTPFAHQSSLQQELEAQESHETKGLPSPMVGSQYNLLNDSLDGEDLDTSLTGLNQSWMSCVSFDSTSTSATFEKYSITALQMASEFKEKKERALRMFDELTALDKSVEVKDKKEQLTQELDNYANKVSSLFIKKKAAEKRAMKLLAASKKLKEENKQLFDERSKAYQKLGTMSLCNDEMSARTLELEARLEQERKTVRQQGEELRFLEQQLSVVTEDLFKTRDEKESLSRSLENEKRLRSSLEEELVTLRKSQDELESQQTLLLVRIKELESELLKTTTELGMEKRRASTLEESIQLSVSRHSDELKELFDAIPTTDTETFNSSRQSPRASSPCITGHMVKTKLSEYVAQSDTSKRIQGVGRDSPDGKPVNEFEERGYPSYQEVSRSQQRKELAQTPLERWLDIDYYKRGPSSISSDSLSPKSGRHEVDGISESPSGKFLQLVEISEKELRTSGSQTDVKDFASIGSQTDLLSEIDEIDMKELLSTGSQTDLLRELADLDFKELASTGSQTDLLRDIEELILEDKAVITKEDNTGDRSQRQRKSGLVETSAIDSKALELGNKPDGDRLRQSTLAVEQERTATNLWRKKLSIAFKIPDEFEFRESATGRALESSVGSSNFVDGVSLRVSPAPNEREIEKQFKTLVLAFHTDQDTLSRRLEVQARARDIAESNMNKELQGMSNLLKEFDRFCITRDMQDMLSLLKSQVEIMKTSSKRLSTQTEQHGCVQQESRMSSGVEVMISHAENLTRHLERVREDLNELRLKERLAADEVATPGPLANGSTRFDSKSSDSPSSSSSPPGQPGAEADSTKQNSLLNFVMAFHTTSMRAKEAIKSFRRRSGAARQERSASAVPRLESDEPVATNESTAEQASDGESSSGPEVVVTESEGQKDEIVEEEQGAEEKDEEETKSELQEQDSDGLKESSENGSEDEELESEEGRSLQTLQRPGVCWRFLSTAFRFTVSLIILMVILFVGLAIMDRHTSFKIDTYLILSKVRKGLEPVGELIHYLKPPE